MKTPMYILYKADLEEPDFKQAESLEQAVADRDLFYKRRDMMTLCQCAHCLSVMLASKLKVTVRQKWDEDPYNPRPHVVSTKFTCDRCERSFGIDPKDFKYFTSKPKVIDV